MTDERHSEADVPSLVADETARAEREASNAIVQFDRVLDMIDNVVRGGQLFRLRVSLIQARISIDSRWMAFLPMRATGDRAM